MTTTNQTAKERAEEMARDIRAKIETTKGSPFSQGLAREVEEIASTALEKLLAENERKEKYVIEQYHQATAEARRANQLQYQLTATQEENQKLKADLKHHQEFTGTICLPTDVPISYANLRSQLTATQEENERLKKEGNIIADSLSECADKLVIVRGQLAATTAENQRLKKTIEGVAANIVCGACAEGVFTGAIMAGRKHTCEIGSLQSQLTSAEARLSEAKALLQKLVSEDEGFPTFGDEIPEEWEHWCRAFLSTLTAEKKEQ